jgi:hypothetical protein
MGTFSVADLWRREAFTDGGRRLGRVEAVAMGRHGVLRGVGVRSDGRGRALRFHRLSGARLEDERLVLVIDSEPSLEVLSSDTA